MKAVIVAILIVPTILQAQLAERAPTRHPHERYRNLNDSATFYKYMLDRLESDAKAKVWSSPYYQALRDTLKAVRHRSKNYIGITVFGEGSHSNVSSYNERLEAMGFTPLTAFTSRGGFGITSKKKRIMFDLNIVVIGNRVGSERGEERIKVSLNNYLNFTWGYDLLHLYRLSLYPYAGLGWRKSLLKYTAPIEYAPGPVEINDAIITNTSMKLGADRFGYLAGLAMDFHSPSAPERNAIVIVFIKGGINRSFRKEYFTINGERYDTGMRLGDWSVTAGLKWVGRK